MRSADVLERLGHSPVDESPWDLAAVCGSCGATLDLRLFSQLRDHRAFERALDRLPSCTRALYRPIPGTPWFEYGPPKEARHG